MGVTITRGTSTTLYPANSKDKELCAFRVSSNQKDATHNDISLTPIYIGSIKKDGTLIAGHFLTEEEAIALAEMLTSAASTSKRLQDPQEQNKTTTEDILL